MATAAVSRSSPNLNNSVTTPRRQGKRRSVEPEALAILMEIPGVPSKNQLKNWLYIARVVSPSDEAYGYIKTYVRNSQEHGFGIRVLSILRIVRKGDYEFEHDEEKKRKFRMMLWHGTKSSCIGNILQNGICKPVEKGQMFGTGLYFADRVSKSAQYCQGTSQPSRPAAGDTGYLLLCDVLCGNMFNAKKARNGATSPPSYTKKTGETVACDSVRCTGFSIPDRSEQVKMGGSVWPIGKTVQNTKFGTQRSNYTVNFNEFIVYDPSNIKAKYLVKVRFEPQPYLY